MLYTASSISLALLEVLVHVQRDQIPDDYYWVKAEIPAHLQVDSLPEVPDSPADYGTMWLNSAGRGGGVVLSVPSVIVPERNFLINPAHSDFGGIRWSDAGKLLIDPRLRGSSPPGSPSVGAVAVGAM